MMNSWTNGMSMMGRPVWSCHLNLKELHIAGQAFQQAGSSAEKKL
jgi:hypothetical protein